MKNIVIPENIFKISDRTHYIYIAKKIKHELGNNNSSFLNAFSKLTDCNLLINLKASENFTKEKVNLDFSDIDVYNLFSLMNNINIKFVLENKSLNIRKWNKKELKPLKLNSFEIECKNKNHIHLNKWSFSEIFNNVKTIILHEVYKLPKYAWHPCNNSTFVVKNVLHDYIQIFPQTGINTVLDLSNIKDISIIFPLFNIYFDGCCFYKGNDHYSILDQIINGPKYIIHKNSRFYTENSSNNNWWKWSETIRIKNTKNFDDTRKYVNFKDFLDFGDSDTIEIPFRDLWMYFAKEQLNDNPYLLSNDSLHRKEILEKIIEIIEEAKKEQNFNFPFLPSYKKFINYISTIPKHKTIVGHDYNSIYPNIDEE